MGIKWGHFSDLHFKDWSGFDTNMMRRKLLASLKEKHITFDYMFITGDILHKGTFDDETKNFIHEIASIAKCSLKNIIICPGNHDAERFRSRKMILDDFMSRRAANPNIEMDKHDIHTLVTTSFLPFLEMYKTILGEEPKSLLHYHRKLNMVNVYVLNTAIFAGQTYPGQEGLTQEERDKENKNLYISCKELFSLTNEADSRKSGLSIAIGHHGLECFVEPEQERLKQLFSELNIDLYLCGHVHKNTNNEISKTNHIRQISCGGLFIDTHAEISFIVGEFSLSDGIKLASYAYNKKPDWSINIEASDPYQDGVCCLPVHRLSQRAEKYDEETLYHSKIKAVVSPSIKAIKNGISQVKGDFFGYQAELSKLKKHLRQNGYIYVHGQQMFGKTQLILKTIYDISTEASFCKEFFEHPLPWIHKCFVVIGKRASSKKGGLDLLIEQANAVLPEPINLKDNEYDSHGFSDILNKLSKVLEQVVVIFDALDEMGMDDLELFSEPLPENCTVVLSSKTMFSKAKDKLPKGTKPIELKGFAEADILAILNRKIDERNVKPFVNFLKHETKGNPCFIRDVVERVRENDNKIPENFKEAYKHITSQTKFFDSFREKWVTGDGFELRKELLKLFYIFECIDYLTIDDMQSYLFFIGEEVDSDSIVRCLGEIIHQLDTNDEDKYKLKYNAFVGYLIKNKKCTALDFKMAFVSVADWMMQNKQYENLSMFFLNWNLPKEIDDKKKMDVIVETSNGILDFLHSEKQLTDNLIIPVMYTMSARHYTLQERFHSYIIKCFDLAEDKDAIISKHFKYLYYTLKSEASREEAIHLIQSLAEKGCQNAMLKYADFLVEDNIYTSPDLVQAEFYYKRADMCVESILGLYYLYEEQNDKFAMQEQANKLRDYDAHEEAQRLYAWNLAQRGFCEKSLQKSCEIFDRQISNKNIRAMLMKASLIFDYKLYNCRIEEAFDLCEKIAARDPEAYFIKGEYLCKNGNKEGIELIEKAYKENEPGAILFIAKINIQKRKKFDTGLLAKLDSIVINNREAAQMLYMGIKLRLIKEYKGFSKDILYHFGFESIGECENYWLSQIFYENDDFTCAFEELEKSVKKGMQNSSINMAYMLRRGEVTSETYTVKALLEPLVAQGCALARMNYALNIIREASGSKGYDEALGHIEQITACSHYRK
ncbi:MAG: metallophosphoesterase [Defluviitaleaceae bacterium]|nr:metallophosphoesterase [Defluviitaleaceae bacterium]